MKVKPKMAQVAHVEMIEGSEMPTPVGAAGTNPVNPSENTTPEAKGAARLMAHQAIGIDGDKYIAHNYEDQVANKPYDLSKKMIKNAPIQTVNISDLTATQDYLKRNKLLDKISQAGTEDDSMSKKKSMPIVVKYHGVCFLDDGHHRCEAARVLGADSVPVRYIDLDEALSWNGGVSDGSGDGSAQGGAA